MDQRGLAFIKDTLKDKYSYNFTWLGIPFIQLPSDMIALQEIAWKVKPDIIIETGIAHGGGLIFYASLLEMLGGDGEVLGIDIEIRPHNRKAIEAHPMWYRTNMIEGSSIDPEVGQQVKDFVAGYKEEYSMQSDPVVMVVLDSMHTESHVLQEMELYGPLVSIDSYMITCDTIIEHLPPDSFPDRPWGVGNNPATAVEQFLSLNQDFERDTSIDDRIIATCNPGGFLRRTRRTT
ncbi:MAG: cephalosporin hydroxylase family protein [Methanoregula sp.]|jgi:cephalosporin hydroxylase